MNGYTLVKINSFEQASEYSKYNSWCITQKDEHFRSYTENDKQFYFLLKDGYEHTCCKKKSGCPLDKYGLSMISILVDIFGNPSVVTTRWNHNHQGENNPNLITKKQIEDITGFNFNDVFKPKYDIKEKLNEITDRIKNGEKPDDVYLRKIDDNKSIIEFNNLFNIIDINEKPLFKEWYKSIYQYDNGLYKVERTDELYNLIDKDYNLLFKEWYKYIFQYDNGLYKVRRTDRLYNLIDINEKPLFKEWYKQIYSLNNELYIIQRTDKLYNVIDKDNNYLFKEWYQYVESLDNGLYEVRRTDDLFNVIDINEKPKNNKWMK